MHERLDKLDNGSLSHVESNSAGVVEDQHAVVGKHADDPKHVEEGLGLASLHAVAQPGGRCPGAVLVLGRQVPGHGQCGDADCQG